MFQYAAKVVCGKSDGSVVAPGEYWTAINVHNPNTYTIRISKRVSIGYPGEKAGPVSPFFRASLGPAQSLEIDRQDIFKHAGVDNFLKGFVEIESSNGELDVVAVYTAAGANGDVVTFHTERVPVRQQNIGESDAP